MDQIKLFPDYYARIRGPADGPDAWGTAHGIHVFQRLNAALVTLGQSTVVILDYSGLARADVSFQREAVVETLKKYRPRLLFIGSNVNDEDVILNLDAALTAGGEALLIRNPPGMPRILGRRLAQEHEDALQAVYRHAGFTSTQLTVPPYGLEVSTASARLAALWKAGLVGRRQAASRSGGREYRYFPIK